MDGFTLTEKEERKLQGILNDYLEESSASRIHKLNLKFGCIDEYKGTTLEDICYFAALSISGSGEVTEFKEFLEAEGESRLASDCDDIINSHLTNDDDSAEIINPIVKGKPQTNPLQTCTLEGLIQKLEKSLRKVITTDPTKEFDVHDAIENLLTGTEFEGKYVRDIEAIPFSVTSAIPDFVFAEIDTALEVKFVKEKKEITNISRQMSQDIPPFTKKYHNIIFLVYDMGKITDVDKFSNDFNSIENVKVIVVKH